MTPLLAQCACIKQAFFSPQFWIHEQIDLPVRLSFSKKSLSFTEISLSFLDISLSFLDISLSFLNISISFLQIMEISKKI